MPSRALENADDEELARRIAGEALCHLDTARKYVRGVPVRGIMLKKLLDEARSRVERRTELAPLLSQTGT